MLPVRGKVAWGVRAHGHAGIQGWDTPEWAGSSRAGGPASREARREWVWM